MRCLFLVMLSAAAFAHPVDDLDVQKPLDAKKLKALPLDELRLLRNSIHARHGRQFESPSLVTFFKSREWYRPNAQYTDDVLSAVEKANVDLIARTEKARGGAWTEAQYLAWIGATLAELVPDGSVGIKALGGGKFEVPLACGKAETLASASSSATEASIVEEYLEGGEVAFTFTVLLRDGPKRWIALQPDSPTEEVIIEKEGAQTVIKDRRYGNRAGLKTRETISAAGCRTTGH